MASLGLAVAPILAISVGARWVPAAFGLLPRYCSPCALLSALALAALACGSIGLGRIRRSKGQLEGEGVARLAVLLTIFELFFLACADRSPAPTRSTVLEAIVGISAGLVLILIYVYAFWPGEPETYTIRPPSEPKPG